MPRIVRPYPLDAQAKTSVATIGTNAGTNVLTMGLAMTPLSLHGKIEKWWIINGTLGTGTGTMTCFLTVSGGTSSTRQISSTIVVDPAGVAGTYQEGAGWSSGMYEVAYGDLPLALSLYSTQGTTNSNAPGLLVGCVWRL